MKATEEFNKAIEKACAIFEKYENVDNYRNNPSYVTHSIAQLTEQILNGKENYRINDFDHLSIPYNPAIALSPEWRKFVIDKLNKKYNFTYSM